MTNEMSFRQRLEAVLRTRDVQQVSDFLIAERQWQAGQQPADPEFAMWMMIAGNPGLRDLHEQARDWLVSHGHEQEANMLLARAKGDTKRSSHAGSSGNKPKSKKRRGGK